MQNITDVDDPLIERAERDGLEHLATSEIALFREDMTDLAISPDHYIGVVESIRPIAAAVGRCSTAGSPTGSRPRSRTTTTSTSTPGPRAWRGLQLDP